MNYHAKHDVNKNILTIQTLLNKQKLVQTIVHSQEMAQKDLLEFMLHRQQIVELETRLKSLHNGDIAHLLGILPVDDRMQIWNLLEPARSAEVLLDCSESKMATIISRLPEQEIKQLIEFMDADDLAYISNLIPSKLMQFRLNQLSSDEQHWLHKVQQYNADSIGSVMTKEVIIIKQCDSINDVTLQLRNMEKFPSQSDKLFVVDHRSVLCGVLSLGKLLLSQGEVKIKDIMSTQVISFSPEMKSSTVTQSFERYDLISAPVINERGKILGRITVEIVMDHLRKENTEDMLNMVGLSVEDDLFSPITKSVKSRGIWLGINLTAAFLVSRVIGLFEATIVEMVSLAILMPIVAAVGGNIGNQTAAIVIRGLTLGKINEQNIFHLAKKEININIINGIFLGFVVALFSYLLYQNMNLSLVIGSAMFLNLIVAAFIGLSVPMVLKKMNYDPTMGSSIITTATADSMGFLIFLGLASIFLI